MAIANPMFKPKGPRIKARKLEKAINEIAVNQGRPVVRGLIDQETMSMIMAEGSFFINPEDIVEGVFADILFKCVPRDPARPEVPFYVLYV